VTDRIARPASTPAASSKARSPLGLNVPPTVLAIADEVIE
jgi:hypothetical protein